MSHVLAQDLRNAVLQAAFEGKLTTQNVNDTPVYKTLSTISQLKKELKIKGTKQSESVDPPYDIPEEWQWVKMQEVIDVRDGTHDSPQYVTEGYPFVTSKNLVNGKINFDNIKFIGEKDFLKFNERSKVDENDILMAMIGSIGKPVLIENKDREFSIKNVALLKHIPHSEINMKYVLHLMNYAEANMKSQATGGVQQFVSLNYLRNYPFPLPPIEEQARIVARVDELMAKIDEYEKIEKDLTELQKKFPGDMKDSILQAAIQGKLTEQLESDENVYDYLDNVASLKASLIKEKKLKKDKTTDMVEDEYPFDIPENWAWTKLGVIAKLQPGKTPPRAEPTWWGKENDVPWVSIADMVADGHVSKTKEFISQAGFKEKFKENISPSGTMIMSFKLTVGRVSYLDIDALHNEAIISIFPFEDEDRTLQKYLFKVLPYLTQYGNSKNAIKGETLNADSLCNLYVPLPPFEEQHRIVDKLDQLLPLCESLKAMI